MSRRLDGSTDLLSEEFERERRFGRCLQETHSAYCRSREGADADARAAIVRALDYWDGEDHIGAHLTAARRKFLIDEECRYHLRQAAQLLMPYVDESPTFKRGGEFA